MKKDQPPAVYLKDYTPPPFRIDAVKLNFELGEETSLVRSVLTVRKNPEAVNDANTLVLNGEELELESVAIDSRKLNDNEYRLNAESLIVPGVPDRFELETLTKLRPQNNTKLEGLYKSSGNFCTQCEAEGFRKITYFVDRPDVMTVYTIKIVADKDKYPVLLSNGNLVEQGEIDDNRHFAIWHDPFPKPSYLFALVAGRLEWKEAVHRTRSGREVVLRIYVEEHNREKCDHALASLQKAMRWDEQTYGLEYDLDVYMIVAVDDFNMGAMENKGLNIFNSKYVLARPDTATDQDYQNIEGVIGHEYFHNWTGNRVTCRDWFQLSLKEGLTVFRDREFTADMTSRAVKRIADVRLLRTHQFAEDSGPMAHPVRPQSYIEINNFYTATVYEKGAEVVRMYQTLLGREGFRKGMRLYFQRHDGQAVTTDDFASAMADANHYDLTQFKRWYDQAGTPELAVSGRWDPDRHQYSLEFTQTCPPTPSQDDKKPYYIPIKLGLITRSGRDIPLRLQGEASAEGMSRIVVVNEIKQRFTFTDVHEYPVPSLLREFSAPVNVRFDYSDEELAFLLAHDSDEFARWDAGQRLAIRHIQRLVAAHQAQQPLSVDPRFLRAFAHTLGDERLDRAFVAEVLTLPGESYIAELLDPIDVEAIHAVRETLRRELATLLESTLVSIIEANRLGKPYKYDAQDAGERRLRNLCLAYLTVLDRPEYHALALQQFRCADNMTDSIGGLHALIDCECAERAQALDEFQTRWHDDPLVLDKWFALQAMSCRSDTLDNVRRLMEHPAFSIKNPNKVRALIGAFAHGNPVNFHQSSGAGYRFVADRVLELDTINPQVAARLVRAFSRWRKYTNDRQALMRGELERLAAARSLSKDVFEVVSKSLK